ncbi:ABC transporter G family member 33-like isoform X5 [Nymphaea colorata]|uniref:ABC transporter G family member 33-like isoform X5 n=1 Tax=Nymphaea colorata TaxID=210225 RepID=UPI00129DFC6A|nr:ABC transporter G family member 33-like isoform X5 [Nymphaea colorata]
MSPTKQGNASTSGDEKMVWRHFIGVGGKGPSAISVLTHGRLLLDRHYRLWVCCWAVTVEMTAGCYDYCCAFIASSVRLFKFQPARPQRLGVLSGVAVGSLLQIPKWWIWLYWMTPSNWTIRGLFTSQYGDIDKVIDVFGEKKAVSLFLKDYFGFPHDQLGVVAVVLIAYAVAFASLFAYCISKLNFQRR